LTREQLINAVWSFDFDGELRIVDTNIKTLRAKLLQCGNLIKTIRGTGYMMEAE
jgi:DNA-binding response OmpR family regulator